jgi:hypothetical protein
MDQAFACLYNTSTGRVIDRRIVATIVNIFVAEYQLFFPLESPREFLHSV